MARKEGLVVLASVHSATLLGVDGQVVTVEVHVSNGLPAYHVVGLPDAAVRESRERVRAALLSSQLSWPLRRLTVNLAPGAIRKTGAGLELAVGLGVLAANEELPADVLDGLGVLGELGLDGSVRPVPGTLALVDALVRAGVDTVVVPIGNAAEAELVRGITVRAARTLGELRACLKGELPWPDWPADGDCASTPAAGGVIALDDEPLDLGDVRGLGTARTALEVAAAGAHHLLLTGAPGAGKTMLARRLVTILPPLQPDEALEVTRIHSVAGRAPFTGLVTQPPFRSPHHTASTPALVGGGSGRPHPGEVTLAHRGTLFLDELGEFAPAALDALRQPLEARSVYISRQPISLQFPAAFQLVACTNPCPCGRADDECRCSDVQRARYRRRLSGPLLDRFDLRVHVRPLVAASPRGESSADVRARVLSAAARQHARYAGMPWPRNAQVPAGALESSIPLVREAEIAWRGEVERRQLTGRGAATLRRVARTLADLDDVEAISDGHVCLASVLREELP